MTDTLTEEELDRAERLCRVIIKDPCSKSNPHCSIELEMKNVFLPIIQALRAERKWSAEIIDYCNHDNDCLCSQWRMGEPHPDGYRKLYGYGHHAKWYYDDDEPECSCGLNKLLAKKKEILGH